MNNIKEETSRFSGAPWFNNIQEEVIMIAGVGGIGSWTSLLVSRLHPKSMYLYDNDSVELVNLAGQLYSNKNIGNSKVDSVASLCTDFSVYNSCFAINAPYTEESEATNVMICGFDNMEARKTYFNNWLSFVANTPEEERSKCLFIDGRLSFNEFQVLCIKGDDIYNINRYKKEFMFDSSEAEETICSLKQTSYLASMIASTITNLLVNFEGKKALGDASYNMPFYTYFNSQLMLLKTEQ